MELPPVQQRFHQQGFTVCFRKVKGAPAINKRKFEKSPEGTRDRSYNMSAAGNPIHLTERNSEWTSGKETEWTRKMFNNMKNVLVCFVSICFMFYSWVETTLYLFCNVCLHLHFPSTLVSSLLSHCHKMQRTWTHHRLTLIMGVNLQQPSFIRTFR